MVVAGLTLAVMTAVVAGRPQPAVAPDTASERSAPCDPRGARVADATAGDSGSLTPAEAAEYERELRRSAPPRVPDDATSATVPVVAHIISDTDGTGDHATETVRAQIDTLNAAFGGELGGVDTGFDFELERVTRTVDGAWFRFPDRHAAAMKRELRQGGAGVLNLYSVALGADRVGDAGFPQEYRERPEEDGVTIDYRTVPGGERAGFDRGYTAVHETGHWLGLLHTFHNGCEAPGDYVTDTPYESARDVGCPRSRDSCPHKEGNDPVRNFMNYSVDACMSEFTEGQRDRMWSHWLAFRR